MSILLLNKYTPYWIGKWSFNFVILWSENFNKHNDIQRVNILLRRVFVKETQCYSDDFQTRTQLKIIAHFLIILISINTQTSFWFIISNPSELIIIYLLQNHGYHSCLFYLSRKDIANRPQSKIQVLWRIWYQNFCVSKYSTYHHKSLISTNKMLYLQH